MESDSGVNNALRSLLMANEQPQRVKTDSRQIEQENTENRRAEELLKERLQFERLLSDLSARFINLAPDQIGREIQNALRQILEFFQVDRCGLVRISPNETSWRITQVAYASDVPPSDAGIRIFCRNIGRDLNFLREPLTCVNDIKLSN
jgi:hypothetical protein